MWGTLAASLWGGDAELGWVSWGTSSPMQSCSEKEELSSALEKGFYLKLYLVLVKLLSLFCKIKLVFLLKRTQKRLLSECQKPGGSHSCGDSSPGGEIAEVSQQNRPSIPAAPFAQDREANIRVVCIQTTKYSQLTHGCVRTEPFPFLILFIFY